MNNNEYTISIWKGDCVNEKHGDSTPSVTPYI